MKKKLGFKIHSGDLIYAKFDKLPELRPRKSNKGNQSIGHKLVTLHLNVNIVDLMAHSDGPRNTQ